MIIDEIIDKTQEGGKLDLKYIYNMGVLDGVKDIVWAIAYYWEMKDSPVNSVITEAKYNIIHALEDYIDDNDYSKNWKTKLSLLV